MLRKTALNLSLVAMLGLIFILNVNCAQVADSINMDSIMMAAQGNYEGAAREVGNQALDNAVGDFVYIEAIDLAFQEGVIGAEDRNQRIMQLDNLKQQRKWGNISRQDFHWQAVGLCTTGNCNYFDRIRAKYGL